MDLLRRHGLADHNDPSSQHRPRREPDPLPSESRLADWRRRLLGDEGLLGRVRAGRGWSRRAVEVLGLGWDGERIIFAIRDRDGRLVGVERSLPPGGRAGGRRKLLVGCGHKRDLWPAPERYPTTAQVFVVEGRPDAVSVATLGLPVVSVSGAGANVDPERFRGRRVVICCDCDRQGRDAAQRWARALAPVAAEVRVLDLDPLRDDGYDATDLLVEAVGFGERGVEQCHDLLVAVADGCDPLPAEEAPKPEREKGPEGGLRFVTAADLRASTPPEPEWVWEGYLARSTATIVAGKPKAGKSTLLAALMDGATGGAPSFLGRRLAHGPVVYVSEEGAGTLADKLPASDHLHVLTRDAAWPKPEWATLVRGSVEHAQRVGAPLLVIDTYAYWSGLGPDQEKDAGAVGATMTALAGAAREGLAVIVVHHQRKAGGEDGDALRGSGGIAGSFDVLVEVERVAGEGSPPGQRQLVAVGRWAERPPPLLVVERDMATRAWRVVGEGGGRGDGEVVVRREALLRALPTDAPGCTQDELAALVGGKREAWHGALQSLLAEGAVRREGAGRKGDPYRYSRPDSGGKEVPKIPFPVSIPAGNGNAADGRADSVPACRAPVGAGRERKR